ncbi:MAG: UDP-N-acetylglucosamine 2-epimerase [Glaciecola sp.]|jgi:hypothetical protein
MKTYKFILLIQQNYTFEILRPMQAEMKARGDQVLWLALGRDVKSELFDEQENVTRSISEAIAFKADAIFVTGNVVPDFIPGLKVQVFHGFEWKKKGHFRIRGSFDLYCTQGPLFTRKFDEFAKQYGYFDVVETGWPKMDNVFPLQNTNTNHDRKQILYLPTFSPRLTSTTDLLPEITRLAKSNEYDWVVKFHPKMDKEVIAKYALMAEQFDNVSVYAKADLMSLIKACDLVLSDTSSAIAESLLLRKPVITYRNSKPDEFIIDFNDPSQLQANIESVFTNTETQDKNFDQFAAEYHPTSDGKASSRVIDAAIQCVEQGLKAKKKKPANLIRNLKLRKQENYWPWTKSS